MSDRITYVDKISLNEREEIAPENKHSAGDDNEIKNVINSHADEIEANQVAIGSISSGTGDSFETRALAMIAPEADEVPFIVYGEDGFNGQYRYLASDPSGYVNIYLYLTSTNEITKDSTDVVTSGGVESVTSLKADLKESVNLFDISTRVDGFYVSYDTGTFNPNASFSYVKIELEPNTDYTWSNQGTLNPTGVSTLQQISFFDENDSHVGGDAGGVNSIAFNTGASIKYVYLNLDNSRLTYKYQLNVGLQKDYYIPYSFGLQVSKTDMNKDLQLMLDNYFKEVVTVTAGTGTAKDFNNIRLALEYCTDTLKEYEVRLEEGDYDVMSYFSESEINDANFKGLDIPNNVTIVREFTYSVVNLIGYLDTNTYGSTTRGRVSTVNFIYSGGLIGINVSAENMRYAVHDDIISNNVDAIRVIDRCVITKIGTDQNTQSYGAGTRSGMLMTVTNSKFTTDDEGAVFSCHTNTGFAKASKLMLKNNSFISSKGYNSVSFGSINSGVVNRIEMIGNNVANGIRITEEGAGVGNGIDWSLTGYGNTKVPVYLEYTDGNNYTYQLNEDNNYQRNRSGSLSIGDLVYLNYSGSGGVFKMSASSTVADLFYGVATENVSLDSLVLIKPFTSGNYIALNETALSGASVGDKVNVVSGVLSIVTGTEFIGVVVLPNFIRIK